MVSTYRTARSEQDSNFHRNEVVSTERLAARPATAPPRHGSIDEAAGDQRYERAQGRATVATSRPSAGAGGLLKAVPELAVEELAFEQTAISGGMGVVRKALYRQGAEVAVKELVPDLARDSYDMFLKEMRLHFSIPPFPHIVPVSLFF